MISARQEERDALPQQDVDALEQIATRGKTSRWEVIRAAYLVTGPRDDTSPP